MADYYFYDITYKDVPKELSLFSEDSGGIITSGNALARFIAGRRKLPITETNKNGETESYINNLITIDDVSVLELSNKKEVKVVDTNQQSGSVESYPYVTIVIDNREKGQIIGIERRRIFADDADTATRRVAALLADNINKALKAYGKAIELTRVTSTHDISSVIRNRVVDHGDKVISIKFSFKPDKQDDGQSSVINDYIRPLNDLMGADGMNAELLYDNGGGDTMKKIRHDLVTLAVELRRHQNYSLNVNFKQFGIYRADDLLWAHFPIRAAAIKEFFSGTRELNFGNEQTLALLKIMDSIKEEITNGELWKPTDTNG